MVAEGPASATPAGQVLPHVARMKALVEALGREPKRLDLLQRLRDAAFLADQAVPGPELIWPVPSDRLTHFLAVAEVEAHRRPRLAEQALLQAQSLGVDGAKVARALARLAHRRGDLPAALRWALDAHRQAPDDLQVSATLVAMRFESGDVEAGREESDRLLKPHAASSKDPEVLAALLGAAVRAGQEPDAVRALSQNAMPKLGQADRLIAEGRAYLRHFLANPRWNREALPRVLAAGQGAMLSPDATADQRNQARRLMAEAYAARAMRAAERGESAPARADFDRAIGLATRGTDAPVADWLARRARLATRGDDTIRVMEAAVRWDPDHPVLEELAKAHLNLGVALLGAGRAPLAQKSLARACALQPDEATAWGRMAQALMASKHPAPEAVLAKLASGRLTRGEAVGQALRGLGEVGQLGLSQRLYEHLKPGWLDRQGRAWCEGERLALAGHGQAARAHLAAAVKAHPSPFGYRRLAQIDQRLAGDRPLGASGQLAEEALAKALALKGTPEDRAALMAWMKVRAQAAMDEKRWELALQYLNRALLLDPYNPNLNALASEANLGKSPALALRHAEAGLAGLGPGSDAKESRLWWMMGRAAMANQEVDKAEASLRQALDVAPQGDQVWRASLYEALAEALEARGQKVDAEAARRQAKQLLDGKAGRP